MSSPTPKVKIQINESLIPSLRKWIQKFNDSDIARMDDAKLTNNILVIDAHDVAFLINIANSEESNLMDAHRLKKRTVESLKNAVTTARSQLSIRYLQDSLDLVEKSVLGGWKNESLKKASTPVRPLNKVPEI